MTKPTKKQARAALRLVINNFTATERKLAKILAFMFVVIISIPLGLKTLTNVYISFDYWYTIIVSISFCVVLIFAGKMLEMIARDQIDP